MCADDIVDADRSFVSAKKKFIKAKDSFVKDGGNYVNAKRNYEKANGSFNAAKRNYTVSSLNIAKDRRKSEQDPYFFSFNNFSSFSFVSGIIFNVKVFLKLSIAFILSPFARYRSPNPS